MSANEKERVVPTVWSRFNKLEKQIAELQKIIDMQYSDPVKYKGEYKPTRFEKWQTKQMNKDYLLHKEWAVPQIKGLKEFLRDYFKYRKDWSELIMKKSPYGSPLDTWMMISLHKFMKDALEKLDSKASGGEKEVGEATTHKHEEGTRRPDSRPNSKPSESEKEFEFQLVEKFIPPRNIKCTDCMNNPVTELIEEFQKIFDGLWDLMEYDKLVYEYQCDADEIKRVFIEMKGG